MPHELTISQKNCRFQVFSYSMQWQWIISQSDCDMQLKVYFIQQPVATISVVGLRRRCKALSKAKLKHTHTHTKDHGHCCVIWYQSHLLQLSGSWQIHYIWKVCSANQWNAPKPTMPAAGIGPQKGSNSFLRQHLTTCRTTNASNVERIGLQSFASSAIFTWPFTNWLPLPQAAQQLLQGKFNSQ